MSCDEASSFCRCTVVALLTLLCLSSILHKNDSVAASFVLPSPKVKPLRSFSSLSTKSKVWDTEHNDDHFDKESVDSSIRENHDIASSFGQPNTEPSQIMSYISDFLQRENKKSTETSNNDASTTEFDYGTDEPAYLIAIPMEKCHELMLELESVQRAILYHCPILVHACLPAAVLRMPLLYVQPKLCANATKGTRASLSSNVVTRLQKVVELVVKQHFNASNKKDEAELDSDSSFCQDAENVNKDGILPLMVPFGLLEIDGGKISSNEVLSTVAQENHSGTRKLKAMVNDMKNEIEQMLGWKTVFPKDLTHANSCHENDSVISDQSDDSIQAFRPRIPFMRLPENWNTIVRDNRKSDDAFHVENDHDDDDPISFLTSDQGGNGISPIFWAQWMDDSFGKNAIRLRELGIYQLQTRSPQQVPLVDENLFNYPITTVQLPKGNADLVRGEAYFQKYQEERLAKAEEQERQMVAAAKSGSTFSENNHLVDTALIEQNDPLFVKTRDRLQAIYSQNISTPSVDDVEEALNDDAVVSVARPGDPDELSSWMRDRIKRAVEARAAKRELSNTKDKPSIVNNPIFNKYKNGSLVKPAEVSEFKPSPKLPPFPDKEYCIGFWRVLRSPTGFDVEESDSSRSDNLVLRVDGTTAGGPILDQKLRQKASGGTWTLIKGDTAWDARLRIRLVIPPRKERILVMEGKLERLSMTSDLSLARNTFGIPLLEERAARSQSDLEELLYCSGHVSVVDAITGANRMDIGKFTLMKINTPTDKSQFTITIPKPIRSQD